MEPDDDAVELFWVQGVVKDGQVVLDPPLGLPDGTVVTVTRYDPEENPLPAGPAEPYDPVKAREALILSFGFPQLVGDPDWTTKVRGLLDERAALADASRNGPPPVLAAG